MKSTPGDGCVNAAKPNYDGDSVKVAGRGDPSGLTNPYNAKYEGMLDQETIGGEGPTNPGLKMAK